MNERVKEFITRAVERECANETWTRLPIKWKGEMIDNIQPAVFVSTRGFHAGVIIRRNNEPIHYWATIPVCSLEVASKASEKAASDCRTEFKGTRRAA